MIAQIKLEMIHPNPYQTRMSEDPEHVRKLAVSIADYGLLQIPAGRLLDANGEPVSLLDISAAGDLISTEMLEETEILDEMGVRVQLAFGHSRYAAYKLLDQLQRDYAADGPKVDQTPEQQELQQAVKNSLEDGQVFYRMPVNLSDLDDEEMFEQAVSENLDRKDLSPIEEAQAMTVYRDQFGKTSPEIGRLFHLSDSAVRNKMRLLKLPDEVKAKLQAGEVSELAARGILSLFELPESIREKAEENGQGWAISENKPSAVVRDALSGKDTAEVTASRIKSLIENVGKKLSEAEWKLTQELSGVGVVAARCKDCPSRMKETNLCLAPACFTLKKVLFRTDYLNAASAASGFPIDKADSDWNLNRIGRWGKEKDQALQLRASKCPNLAIHYMELHNYDLPEATLKDLGFPNAAIVCTKREQFCNCKNGLKALAEAARREARAAAVDQPVQPQAPESTPADKPYNPADIDIQGLHEDDVEDFAHDTPNYLQDAASIQVVDEGLMAPVEILAVEPILSEESSKPVVVTAPEKTLAEQLQQAAHDERIRKKKNGELVKKATKWAGQMFGSGLAARNPALWLKVAGLINYALGSSEMQGKSFSELAMAIGEYLATRTLPYDPSDIDYVLKNLNKVLRSAGFCDITQAELEQNDELPSQPKNLAEVFDLDLDAAILPKL